METQHHYGGIQSANNTQINPFNMLYWSINNQDRYYQTANSIRYKLDLSRKGYDNIYNQIPNGLQLNGRPYQQLFELPSIKVFYRDYEDNGRNLNIFKNTDERMVDVSGVLYKAKDIPSKPLIDERNFQLKSLGFIK